LKHLNYNTIAGACAFAIAASFATGAQAQTSVQIYGVADAGIVIERGGPQGNFNKITSGVASGSRLGFRGNEDLGGGNSVFFQLENGFDMDTGAAGQGGRLFGRQAFVGLKGAAGTLSLGRQYSPFFKVLDGIVDPFSTGLAGDSQNFFLQPTRIDNSVEYQSPVWNGVQADIMYGAGEDPKGADRKRNLGGSLTYNAGPLALSLVHHRLGDDTGNGTYRSTMLAARYDFGVVAASGGYARNRNFDGTTSRDALVGVRVPAGTGAVVASYMIHREDDGAEAHARQAAIGYIYPLSKRTDLYTAYAHIVNKDGAAFTVGNATEVGTGPTGFNLGVRHVF
jgi:predicted porin